MDRIDLTYAIQILLQQLKEYNCMTLNILFHLALISLIIAIYFCMKYKKLIILKLKIDHSKIYEKIGPVDKLDNDQINKEQKFRKYISNRKYVDLKDCALNRLVNLYNIYGYFFISCFIFLLFIAYLNHRSGDTFTILRWLSQIK